MPSTTMPSTSKRNRMDRAGASRSNKTRPAAAPPPDLDLFCTTSAGEDARCSLWWHGTPSHDGHRVGLIGRWQAPAGPASEAAEKLLRLAAHELRSQGCTLAVGPMDGATWQPYRFVTESGTHPPFFLEPYSPPAFAAQFERAGFAPIAHYRSAIVPNLGRLRTNRTNALAHLASHGLRLRPLDGVDDEAEALYALTQRCFADNFLYTPLPFQAFRAELRKLEPHLRPELTLVAKQHDEPVGFVLMVPDLLQQMRGEHVDTVVIKTLAVDPRLSGRGIGSALVNRAHSLAREHGFRRVIHALMHEANPSSRISAHHGATIRRYALFAKPLGS
ncbi:MAG: GNAT family N-acetyltransferase [Bacteroidota bacterium]